MKPDNSKANVKIQPDFLDPEVFKKLETDCYNLVRDGKMIDYSDFPAAEYRYFERLCGVYGKYKSGEISIEAAKAQKLIYFQNYQNDIALYRKYAEICMEHQETVKVTEQFCSELCKMTIQSPDDVKAAIKTALKIISAARGEDVTEKTVLKKLEGAG